jgi:hypothetical protein
VIYVDKMFVIKVSRRYCSIVGLHVNSQSISQSMMIVTSPDEVQLRVHVQCW